MKKIFIGIIENAGYIRALSKGFQEIGQDATAVVLAPSSFVELPTHEKFWLKFAQEIGKKVRFTPSENLLRRMAWKVLLRLIKFGVLLWAICKFDTFIFTCGTSFFTWDLPLLKCLNKKIIIILNGSDSRPPYLNAKCEHLSIKQLMKHTQKIKQRVDRIERYATAIVCASQQGYFHKKPVIMGLAIGKPHHLPPYNVTVKPDPHLVRIYHSSTHFKLKGTQKIRDCIQNLKLKGYPIDYIEVQKTPHTQAITLMASCDIIIDQLYSDSPLSMQTLEGMVLGKAVIIGGYYAEKIADDIAEEYIPSNCFIIPEKLEETLENLIQNNTYRELGQKAKSYIQDHYSNAKVAKRFLDIIDGNVPLAWTYNPYQNRYLFGIGLSKEAVTSRVTQLVSRYGKDSLCLTDKPELETLFLRLIPNK